MLVKYGAMTDVYGDWYGLDFGTSNTAVSVFKNGEAFSLPIDQYNDEKEILLSAICFFKSKQYYGREAIDLYLKEISHGEKTEKDLEIRLIRSFKSLLSREVETKTVIEGKILTIEDIVSSYFIELKRRSDSIVGKDIKKIIVGRPVRFVGQKDTDGFQAEKKIENCLKRAGFSEVKFEYEPVAAARRYGAEMNGKVLVFDFGGGTLDVALVDLDSNRLLGFGGEAVGGDLIDYMIYDLHFAKHFGKELKYQNDELSYPIWAVEKIFDWSEIVGLRNNDFYSFLFSLKNRSTSQNTVDFVEYFLKHNLTYDFRKKLIDAKIALSVQREIDFKYESDIKNIEEKLNRSEFENELRGVASMASSVVDKVLDDAKKNATRIDKVVMTGGSSLIPFFQKMLADKFGANKIVVFEPFTSVSKGLVLLGQKDFFR